MADRALRALNRRVATLVILIAIGALARLTALQTTPPGLHPDEAVNAYEARRLAESLAADDQRPLPLTVSMHGGVSSTEAAYVWLAAPFSSLSLAPATAIRLPAALAGILLIPCAYWLAFLLGGSRSVALLVAALIAVEPFAVHYARLGLRASLVPPLLTLGLALALSSSRGPRTRRTLLLAATGGVVLSLTLLVYTPARLFVPLLLGALLVFALPRDARAGLLLAPPAVALLVALPWSLSPEGGARFAEISLSSQADGPLHGAWLFVRGYVLHYSPRMLFWGSSSRGFWAEGVSPLLLIEAPLVLLGLVSLTRRAHAGAPRARFLVAWFLLFPVASSLTWPAPNPMRAIFAVPLMALVAGSGYRRLRALLRHGRRERWASRMVGAGVLASALVAGHSYFVRFPLAERTFWYSDHPAAIRAALQDAENADSDLIVECSRLEAALVTLCAAEHPSSTHYTEDRASVHIKLGDSPPWTGTLSSEAFVLRDGAGQVRLRHPVR